MYCNRDSIQTRRQPSPPLIKATLINAEGRKGGTKVVQNLVQDRTSHAKFGADEICEGALTNQHVHHQDGGEKEEEGHHQMERYISPIKVVTHGIVNSALTIETKKKRVVLLTIEAPYNVQGVIVKRHKKKMPHTIKK